jgi:hypothetical protein
VGARLESLLKRAQVDYIVPGFKLGVVKATLWQTPENGHLPALGHAALTPSRAGPATIMPAAAGFAGSAAVTSPDSLPLSVASREFCDFGDFHFLRYPI